MMLFPRLFLAEADAGIFSFLHTMRGPAFLVVYAVWFFLLFGIILLIRHRGNDSRLVTLVVIGAFEALGIARIFVGSSHGLHKWQFLLAMMVVGFVAFIMRTDHFDNWSSG
ncbi:MAG: hypothetical protein JWM04_1772, partial [Verrucomicrobiales bacterium]|nr:hypothetical protein [Verrucomicrobiales bacterium]